MQTFLTIVAIVEGVVIGVLALLRSKAKRDGQIKTAAERKKRVKAEVEAARARKLLKKKVNAENNEALSDDEADDKLDRLLGDDSSSGDGDS